MAPEQRVPADEAMLFVSSIRERLLSSALTSEESFEALQKSAALGIIGGKIHDFMPAQCGTEAVRRLRTP